MKTLTKKYLKELKKFRVKRICNVLSIDDMRGKITQWVESNGLPLEELEENDNQFAFRTHVWLKPNITQGVLEGVVTMNSTSYCFTWDDERGTRSSHGEIKDMIMTPNGWDYKMYNGQTITYEIVS